MSYYLLEQLPILSPDVYTDELLTMIVPRVVELNYNSYDLGIFAKDCGFKQEPFKWSPSNRAKLIAELDAIYAHLYNLVRILSVNTLVHKFYAAFFRLFLFGIIKKPHYCF